MSHTPNFAPALAKLKDRDYFVQGDAGSEVYDEWFRLASLFAKGELEGGVPQMAFVGASALEALVPAALLDDSATDPYVVRALLENLRKILNLHITKPKFAAIAHGPDGKALVKVLTKKVLPVLTSAAFHSSLPEESRIEMLVTLQAAVEFGTDLHKANPRSHPALIGDLDINRLVSTAANTDFSSTLRETVWALLKQISATGSDDPALGLASISADAGSLEVIWAMGGQKHEKVLATLLARAKAAVRGKNPQFALELVFSMHAALRSGVLDVSHEDGGVGALVPLIAVCDQVKSAYKDDLGGDGERSAEVMELLYAILTEDPDFEPLLTIALRPITLESLHMLSGLSDRFSHDTWVTVILPALESQVAGFSYDGVSGDQLEQEVVNFIRDAARIYYINKDQPVNPRVGAEIFRLVTECIRHGYIETERFPWLASVIATTHMNDGGLEWLGHLFEPGQQMNHKTARAFNDIALSALGMNTSADIAEVQVNGDVQGRVLAALVGYKVTKPALTFLRDVANANPAFIAVHEIAVADMIESMNQAIDGMLSSRRLDGELLTAMQQLLVILAERVTPMNANATFEILVKLLSLTPSTQSSAVTSDSIVRVLAKLPANVPLNLGAVRQALLRGDVHVREALAEFVPHLTLNDASPEVRLASMRVLARRPALLPQYASFVLRAAQRDGKTVHDPSMDLFVKDRAIAAAPLLASLATVHPESMSEAMDVLIKCAKDSKQDTMIEKVDKEVVKAIDSILEKGNMAAITQWANSGTSSKKQLKALSKISVNWAQFAARIDKGLVVDDANAEQDRMAASVFESLKSDVERGQLMAAARGAATMRTRHPSFYALNVLPWVQKELLPLLGANVLPTPKKTGDGTLRFSKDDLARYDQHAAVLEEVERLFPYQGAVISSKQRLMDLNTAMVQSFLERGSSAGARSWMREHRIHSPALASLIDQWEFSNGGPVEASMGLPVMPPSAPRESDPPRRGSNISGRSKASGKSRTRLPPAPATPAGAPLYPLLDIADSSIQASTYVPQPPPAPRRAAPSPAVGLAATAPPVAGNSAVVAPFAEYDTPPPMYSHVSMSDLTLQADMSPNYANLPTPYPDDEDEKKSLSRNSSRSSLLPSWMKREPSRKSFDTWSAIENLASPPTHDPSASLLTPAPSEGSRKSGRSKGRRSKSPRGSRKSRSRSRRKSSEKAPVDKYAYAV